MIYKEVRLIRVDFVLLICLLLISAGCNQRQDYKELPAPETSRLVSSKQNPSGLEAKMKANITMKAVPDTYSSADKVHVIITNTTSSKAYTDMNYSIEHYEDSEWKKIPLNIVYNLVKISLLPNKSEEFTIYLYPEQYDYKPGQYRVFKTISTISDLPEKHSINRTGSQPEQSHVLTAEFTLE